MEAIAQDTYMLVSSWAPVWRIAGLSYKFVVISESCHAGAACCDGEAMDGLAILFAHLLAIMLKLMGRGSAHAACIPLNFERLELLHQYDAKR